MEFLGKVGIDYKTLAAQLVNFVALVIILWILLYKPLLKIFEEREERTKKLAGDIKSLEAKRIQAEEDARASMQKSEEEASKIIEQGRKAAIQFKEERVASTREEVDRIMDESRSRLLAEQTAMKEVMRKASAQEIQAALKGVAHELEIDALIHEKLLRAARNQLAKTIAESRMAGPAKRAEILSPLPLARGDISFFTTLIEKKLKSAERVSFLSDPALVAGVIIKFDTGHLFDFSFSGALEKKVADVSRP